MTHPLPTDLPAPTDDGAATHLPNATIPALAIPSTSGAQVDLSKLPGLTIVFCYPRTAPPREDIPAEWNAIPGARGCTPQACAIRDATAELLGCGASAVYGMSTQGTAFQREVVERLHLPYELLSDEGLEFARAMALPTFEFRGLTLMKRLTLAVREGKVVKVWYPVFPSDRSAAEVLEWLKGEV